MVNTLLKVWEESPNLELVLHNYFPWRNSTLVPEEIREEYRESLTGDIPKWDTLREIFGPEAIYINQGTENEWRGVSLTLENLEEWLIRGRKLEGSRIDTFTIQAQRKGTID